MGSWAKLDNAASAPTWLSADTDNTNKSNDKDNAIFVSDEEAAIASNRAKGITGPGWWVYHTAGGRHFAECLVPMKGGTCGNAVVGDLGVTGDTAVEDAIVADA
jgi:hypothetical protein